MSYMEKGESRLKFARRWTYSNLSVGLPAVLHRMDISGAENFYLPVAGGSLFLSSQEWPGRSCHNDFEVRVGKAPDFCSFPRSEAIFLLSRPALHKYVDCPMSKKKILLNSTQTEEVEIPQFSAIVG